MILETPRLIWRPFTDSDLFALHSIFFDQDMMKFYSAPFTVAQTQDWI